MTFSLLEWINENIIYEKIYHKKPNWECWYYCYYLNWPFKIQHQNFSFILQQAASFMETALTYDLLHSNNSDCLFIFISLSNQLFKKSWHTCSPIFVEQVLLGVYCIWSLFHFVKKKKKNKQTHFSTLLWLELL